MTPNSEIIDSPPLEPQGKFDLRLAAGAILLLVAAAFTWLTIDGLAKRRLLRYDLAEITHVRYGMLNADQWVDKLVPILNAKIDSLDLTASSQASLLPTVENALNELLDTVKAKMTAPNSQNTGLGALLGQGNSLMVNMMVEMLRPHVPEYSKVVLQQLSSQKNKDAIKRYIKSALAEGAKATFGNVDMTRYDSILQRHGCTNGSACEQVIASEIQQADSRISLYYLTVLAAGAIAFLLLMAGQPVLRRPAVAVLMLFCLVLLAGGILTPMIEVEAKITRLGMTFLGQPIEFTNQLLYFQSKSVLEVFHTLITYGRPDMWVVGVLVLMFSVVFPSLKTCTLALCLYKPGLLRSNRLVKFFALESSKWSMADVMALAIFMSFVAFNGLIPNALGALK